ncbi:hypothetical protein ASF73_20640 [Xanthomonas sp. Leaf131]|nr:hypothetical protein ASF73_20640 [Xanthomonas sp. Leaf131]
MEEFPNIRLERVVRHLLVQMLYIGIALIFVLLVYPFDLGKDAPAWVQAVGSIAGIGVAIWIPLRIQAGQEHRIERDRVLRTKAFAIAFQPLIEQFRGGLVQAWVAANDFDHPDGPLLHEAGGYAQLPDALTQRASEIHEIGPAATGLLRAIVLAGVARQALTDAAIYQANAGVIYESDGRPLDMDAPDDYLDPLKEARIEVEQTLNQINFLIG